MPRAQPVPVERITQAPEVLSSLERSGSHLADDLAVVVGSLEAFAALRPHARRLVARAALARFALAQKPLGSPAGIREAMGQTAVAPLSDSELTLSLGVVSLTKPPGFRSRLFRYQAESLAHMLRMEAGVRVPDLSSVALRGGDVRPPRRLDALSGEILHGDEDDACHRMQGGILCENMGFGKTVIMLALICCTRHERGVPRGERVVDFANPERDWNESLVMRAMYAVISHRSSRVRDLPRILQERLARMQLGYLVHPPPPTARLVLGALPQPFRVYISAATLLILPGELVNQWLSEIRRHLEDDSLDVEVLATSSAVELADPRALAGRDIVIVTHSALSATTLRHRFEGVRECHCQYIGATRQRMCSCPVIPGLPGILRVHWQRVIVDEGHPLGSRASNRTDVATALRCEARWVCSGTPLATGSGTDLARLASLLSFCMGRDHLFEKKLLAVETELWSTPELFFPLLQQTLDRALVRHIPADILLEAPLPRLEIGTVMLEFAEHERLRYNARVATVAANLIASEGEDQDSLLYVGNAVHARTAVTRLAETCVHHAPPLEKDVASALDVLIPWLETNLGRLSKGDAAYVERLIRSLQRSLDVWAAPHPKVESLLYRLQVSEPTDWDRMKWLMFERHGAVLLPGGGGAEASVGGEQLGELVKSFGRSRTLPGLHEEGHVEAEAALPPITGESSPRADIVVDLASGAAPHKRVRFDDTDMDVDMDMDEPDPSGASSSSSSASSSFAISSSSLASSSFAISSSVREADPSFAAASATPEVLVQGPALPSCAVPTDARHATCGDCVHRQRLAAGAARIQTTSSTKLNYVLRAVLDNPDDRFLVFSNYNNVIYYLCEALRALRIPHASFHNGLKLSVRAHVTDTFNTNPNLRVFVMATRLAAFGINVTSANWIILLDPVPNESIERQAVGRAHRLGQTRAVRVDKLVVRGTVEDPASRSPDPTLAHFVRGGVQSAVAADLVALALVDPPDRQPVEEKPLGVPVGFRSEALPAEEKPVPVGALGRPASQTTATTTAAAAKTTLAVALLLPGGRPDEEVDIM